MPNHYTTQVTLKGDLMTINQFRSTHIHTVDNDGPRFDLNTIIPMPECLVHSQSSSTVSDGLVILGRDDVLAKTSFGELGGAKRMLEHPWVKEAGVTDMDGLRALLKARQPEAEEAGRKAIANYEATGYTDWYRWSVDNWGTKWNSYEYRVVKQTARTFTFEFQTAWAPPEPCLQKLIEMWPTLEFRVKGRDEGERSWSIIL